MRFLLPILANGVLLCTAATPTQPVAATDPTVLRAQAEIERLKGLADMGAIPRAQVEEAEDKAADVRDSALMRDYLGKQNLTGFESDEMVAAAQRCLDRRQQHLNKMRDLVNSGLAATSDLQAALQEVLYASQQYSLAMSSSHIAHALSDLERTTQALREHSGIGAMHYAGSGLFTAAELTEVETAFSREFARPLPISALGETATHRALGFDHRGRVDVALAPDQPEGAWLLRYLESRRIPYFAFRQAIAGKATGPHIHIGPESTRLSRSAMAD